MLLRGEDRGFRLVEVGHGLDDDKVSLPAGFDGLGEDVVGLLEGEGSRRLEQLADRADVERDLRAGAFGGFAGIFDGGADQLSHGVAGGGHLEAVGAEGVGVDDIASVFDVAAVDVDDPFRLFDVERLGNRAERHALGLEHGAHGAV